MKNFKIALTLVVSVLIASQAYADNLRYSVSDLEKFETTNVCKSCDLSSAALKSYHSWADLTNSNLSNMTSNAPINLFHAVLIGTNLTRANLKYAELSQADFTSAAVYGADFSYANLYKSTITPEQLAGAASICNAILPDGSKGQC